ncbi:hypothetical protein ABB37_08348 [Leptomonas pyrrhocoris]|uniref:Uncharacterized protein n=1 Tax=Leptomonas pyrrhocoris TaxID=157538 RepID=A0A0M9FTN2_LEPPY|nr:hypothetical protein ABB37_08348 [Leptomonas pyrrhocoris]KPA75835.1 hypothetical protein ABB37_08348 [Leptomonas pyrrhocoris]|eukprot:XP_015654274.1 hypothetical protein ABB37_08348 [Leptomonas pyrrhocoris]
MAETSESTAEAYIEYLEKQLLEVTSCRCYQPVHRFTALSASRGGSVRRLILASVLDALKVCLGVFLVLQIAVRLSL